MVAVGLAVVRAIVRRWWLFAAALLAGIVVWVAAQFIGNVPLPAAIPTAAQSSTVYADDGSTLALFHGTEDRIIVPLNQISTNLQQAVVAAEDRTFFTDSGFSLRGTLRALWVDIRGGSITQGGSTITQEYVRGVYAQIGNKRTIARKVKEAILAIKFARKYSKQEILSDYLNTVYFGRGAYGAQAAAQAYFNTSAANLTVSEAAYLAGILRGPEFYQPDSNPSGATRIRDTVLADLVDAKYLTQAQANTAKAQGLPFTSAGAANPARGAYFVEYVRRLLETQYNLSDSQVLTGGLKIYTTLDPKMQAAAENAISSTLTAADDPQAAMVAMSTDGSIRAMVGGRNVTDPQAAQGFNYAAQQATGAGRQPGSSFKPFTLATFISSGYSIQSMFQAPMSIEVTSKQCQNLDGSNWSVTNYNNETFPDLNVTQATANSVNTVYAQIINLLGPKSVTAMAAQIGGFTNLAPVCSIALGTSPATPLTMARAYATFATQGSRPDPLAVLKVVTPTGQVLVNNAAHSTQVLDPNVANTVNQVLTQTLINGTASGKGIGRPAAGKTGTTENLVDAWFVGYTPSLSSAVWMGYPTNPTTHQTPAMTDVHGIQVTGGTLPATIWQRFMKAALTGTPPATFVAPTVTGKIVGPVGAPCPAGQAPTPDWQCLAPGAPCPVASPTTTVTPAAPSGTVTPCPTPSEILPPDIIIPSPTTTVTPAPKALGPTGPPRGGRAARAR